MDVVSNCTTVGNAKTTVIVYSTFTAVATIFYMTAVFLIINTRAYHQFVHRLTLYLSFAGVFRSVSFLFQVIPLDVAQPENNPVTVRPGWDGLCTFGGFIVQYAGLVQTLMILWICIYIFAVVVLQRQLRQRKHEVIGVVAIIVAPFLLSWEPFVTDSYGLSGTRCWIKDTTCNGDSKLALAYTVAIVVVPQLLLTMSGLALILIAILSLGKKVVQKFLAHHHWLAIRDILPLSLYPLVYSLVWLARLLDIAIDDNFRVFGIVTSALLQACSVVLPLSLLLRSSVRNKLCRRSAGLALESPCDDCDRYSLYEN